MRALKIVFAALLATAFATAHAAQRTLLLSTPRAVTGQYVPIEFTIDGLGEYRNPFDPDEVDLALELRTPRGQSIALPAFFGQSYQRQTRTHNGRPADWFYPAGMPRWQARFAPVEVGVYSCVARLRDAKGVIRSGVVRFRCIPSKSHGFVRVSRQDPRFFVHDDGAPFFAIGQNVAFVKELRDTETIFRHMAAAGANYARVWASCDDWGMCVEGRKSAWGRSWDWRPPLVPEPGGSARTHRPLCVHLAGADGATVPVDPSHPVALRAGTRYVLSGSALSDGSARLSLQLAGAPLGDTLPAAMRWTAFRREFTTRPDQWWLDGMALRLAGTGEVWVRNLSLREASGGPELLWEADPNRPVLGRYNPLDCFLLDQALQSAAANSLAIQLVLLTRDLYMSSLRNDAAPEYDAAIADARRLLRYAVARWGAFTSLAIWEYFNENDPGLPTNRFYTECGRFLASIDPYHHLRATSAWGDSVKDWRLPALDVANLHYYLRPADGARFKDEVTTVLERAQTLRREAPAKPALFAEFGLARDDWQQSPYAREDADAIHLHNALWTSALSGLSGTVHPWWWEDIEKRNAYRHYRAVAAFVRSIPFGKERLQTLSVATADTRWRVVGLQTPHAAWLWLSDAQATWWRQVAERHEPAPSRDVTITVQGNWSGGVRVQWWDTRNGTIVRSETMRAGRAPLRLRAPVFTGDIACSLRRVR